MRGKMLMAYWKNDNCLFYIDMVFRGKQFDQLRHMFAL